MNNKRDKETRKSTNLTVLSCVVVMVIMLVKNLFSTKKDANKPKSRFFKMSSSKTTLVIYLQYMLITIDILCNALGDFIGRTMISRLSAYVLQDLCLILSLIIFFLLFFRKKILQQRLLTSLMRQNWATFLATLTYLTLTITLQSLTVQKMAVVINNEKEKKSLDVSSKTSDYDSQLSTEEATSRVNPSFWMDDNLIVIFFLLHRTTSALYYFSYRNSTSNLHDSNFIKLFKSEENLPHPQTSASTSLPPSVVSDSTSASSTLPRYARPTEHPFSRQS